MQETTMFDQPETSPWGEIQRCVPICHGVYQVSTASHGGVMLTVRLARALLSSEARACGFQDGRYLCFEEDCQAAAVLLELLNKGLHKSPQRFAPDQYRAALESTVKRYFPQYWRSRKGLAEAEQAKQIHMREGR